MWYVYFLELKNGYIYVGSTNDLRRRFASHQEGGVASTRIHLPAILRSYEAVDEELSARRLEQYFKSGSGKAFAKKRFLARDTSGVLHRLRKRRAMGATPRLGIRLYGSVGRSASK